MSGVSENSNAPAMASDLVGVENSTTLRTPLAAALSGLGTLSTRKQFGAETIASFWDTSRELQALLTNAGIYDLGWHSFLRCTGVDRVRWLNGMVTNSVAGLKKNQGCYAFVLNAQGRIQGDCSIFNFGDALWVETDRAQIATLSAFLEHYIIMDDVILEAADDMTAIGIAGPHAWDILAAAGFSVPKLASMNLTEVSWRERTLFLVSAYNPLVPRYEIWCSVQDVLELWNTLLKAGTALGALPCGADAVEQLRILEGTPAYSIDITERDLPQETNQMRALHFSKGCYLGQEIVERIRSRGNVHRTLHGFVVHGTGFPIPQPGTRVPLFAEGQGVGELTSVARITLTGVDEKVLALGTIRREALERKSTLSAADVPVTPAETPFHFSPV